MQPIQSLRRFVSFWITESETKFGKRPQRLRVWSELQMLTMTLLLMIINKNITVALSSYHFTKEIIGPHLPPKMLVNGMLA